MRYSLLLSCLVLLCSKVFGQPILLTDTVGPLVYAASPSDGEYGFMGIPAQQRQVKLIPNLEAREKAQIRTITGITGVAHFFLDLDLTSGFVHPYTTIFFNRLRPNDYVLKYTPKFPGSRTGTIEYVKKKDLQQTDELGKNLAFFRQWRLTELALGKQENTQVLQLKPCKVGPGCQCPQLKPETDNPFGPEVPLWQRTDRSGFAPIQDVQKLGEFDGGTVVLIWETVEDGVPTIWFQDMHASPAAILKQASAIRARCFCDPTIAISDAGPFARKVRSDSKGVLHTDLLKRIAPNGKKFGAGFGYLLNQENP